MKRLFEEYGLTQKEAWDRYALKFMDDCETILDLGCGIGRFISLSPDRITGLDQNEESIKICKKINSM